MLLIVHMREGLSLTCVHIFSLLMLFSYYFELVFSWFVIQHLKAFFRFRQCQILAVFSAVQFDLVYLLLEVSSPIYFLFSILVVLAFEATLLVAGPRSFSSLEELDLVDEFDQHKD
jgi:hypothetical protein